MKITIEHDLSREELRSLVLGLVHAEDLGDQVAQDLAKSESPDTPEPELWLGELREQLRYFLDLLYGRLAEAAVVLSRLHTVPSSTAYTFTPAALAVYLRDWARVATALDGDPISITGDTRLPKVFELPAPFNPFTNTLNTACMAGVRAGAGNPVADTADSWSVAMQTGQTTTEASLGHAASYSATLRHAGISLHADIERRLQVAERRASGLELRATSPGDPFLTAMFQEPFQNTGGDLERIAAFETRYAYHYAALREAQRRGNSYVVFLRQDDSCEDCRRLYWDRAAGKPRVYLIDDIFRNIAATGGINTGPHTGWKALPVVHPFCRCRPMFYRTAP